MKRSPLARRGGADAAAVDIINVVSVTSLAQVNQMIEDNDDDVQNALYWRQALDVRTMELSVRGGIPLPGTRREREEDLLTETSRDSPSNLSASAASPETQTKL